MARPAGFEPATTKPGLTPSGGLIDDSSVPRRRPSDSPECRLSNDLRLAARLSFPFLHTSRVDSPHRARLHVSVGTLSQLSEHQRNFRALLSRCVSFLAVDALIEAHFLGGPGNLHRRDLLNDPQHAQREQEG